MLSSENDQKICSNCSYQNCIEHELNNWEKIDSPQSSMSSSSASLYDLLTNEQSILQCSSNKSPSMISETPVRKIRNVRKSENHHCAVCGDRPTGYHYNVLSCNGCKTFFRRTVINHRTFTCTKGGKCQFTKDFRCACRACRFEKCVRVGMKTSAIQFSQASGNVIEIEDDQKEVSRKNSLNRNRHLSTFPMVRRPLAEFKSNIYRMVKEIAHKEKFISKYRVAGVIHVEADLSLSEVLRSKKILRRLKETFIPGVFYHRDPVKYWMISDLHLVVEFAKMFSVFQELDEYDQRCLLHQVGGSLHVAVQSFYSFFNAKSDCIVFPDQVKAYEAKMAIVKNDPRSDIFVSYYSEMYTHPVYDLIRSDMNEVEFSFFKALLLFRPDNIDMSLEGRSTVNKEQNRLSNLLRNYLVQEYGPQIGICRLSTILLLLTTFINYGEKRREYLTLVKLLQFKVARIGTDVYIKKPEKL